MNDEAGYTIIELLVGAMVSLVVFGAIMTMVQVSTRNQDRITERVYANQRGRPAMNTIIDQLHSACVSSGLSPVRPGSTETSLILYSKSGEGVSPTPDLYTVSLSGGEINETIATGGGTEPADWIFGSPSSPIRLVDGVGTAKLGTPSASVPLFRYFAYEGGQVATSPLPTPLSVENAAKTVQVNIAFTVMPSSQATSDAGAAITLSDSATLRIEPASEDSAQVNLPCV
jgi:hypothetical protein